MCIFLEHKSPTTIHCQHVLHICKKQLCVFILFSFHEDT
jgi:hypothetical protein